MQFTTDAALRQIDEKDYAAALRADGVADIMKKRRDCRKDRLWFGLLPAVGGARKAKASAEEQDASGWLAAAEKAVRSGRLAEIRNFIIKG